MLKSVIKASLRQLGFELRRIIPQEPENPIAVLDLLVLHYLNTQRNFFFVQIGANDGVRGDPLRHLILKYRLAGLLVEPLPDLFGELRGTCGQPQLRYENAALAASDGPVVLFRFAADAPTPDYAHGLARFNKAAISWLATELGLTGSLESVEVPGMTLASLLDRHEIDKFALLQVDTEGFDYEILKMTLHEGHSRKL